MCALIMRIELSLGTFSFLQAELYRSELNSQFIVKQRLMLEMK